jgi:alkanesulfonate monooxygenase SsuD/methylene tetrahydromethanopterin reductase-like flavin-dependent oxidoreductase (luciferase family)
VGAGWLAEEFAIVGRSWEDRGPRLEESLEVMVRLWNDDAATYSGRFFAFPPAAMEPKPVTRPHPPFIFGGTSRTALRRAARLGDGWLGVGLGSSYVVEAVRELRRLRIEVGRGEDPFELTAALGAVPAPRELDQLALAGLDRVVLRLPGRSEIPAETEALASELWL